MRYMNAWDIVEARAQFENHPVLSKATTFLEWFANEVNEHSDGWSYWSAPVCAAGKLQALIQAAQVNQRAFGDTTTMQDLEGKYKAALIPIKRFFTVRGNAAGMVYKPWDGAL